MNYKLNNHFYSFFFLTIFFVSIQQSHAQNKSDLEIDSIQNILKNKKLNDTSKVNNLVKLAFLYRTKNLDKSLELAIESESLAKKSQSNSHIAKSAYLLAVVYYYKGEYTNSVIQNDKSIAIWKKLNNLKEVAKCIAHAGRIFEYQGDYAKAIDYQFKALRIRDSLNLKEDVAASYNTIGILYKELGQNSTALNYYEKSIKIRKELKQENLLNGLYNNISNVYADLGKLDTATLYIDKAIEISTKYGDENEKSMQLNNKGEIYVTLGKYDEALSLFKKALAIRKKINNKMAIVYSLQSIASVYLINKNYSEAEKTIKEAIKITKEVGSKKKLFHLYETLAEIYYNSKRQDSAYYYLKQYITVKDSVQSENIAKQINELEAKYENEKKELEIKNLQNEKAVNVAEAKKQNIQKLAFAGGFFLMLVLAIVIFKNYRQKQKANEIISAQKTIVEHQKELVEEKNKEILDSITYAKRIQTAILPPARIVKEYLPNSFIFYKPKDIVAGDFYWMENINNKILFAAADCTGHGVPGAMVSVICNNSLNRSVKEYAISDAGKILNKTREIVIQEFEKSDEEVKDGMDISLCVLDSKANILNWAGANNPLWIIRKNKTEIEEIKANKQPIGKQINAESFTSHTINLNEGDTFYIFTDGFADQFGGGQGKKFKSSKLKELLLSIQHENMDNQKTIIDKTFEEWKGNLEQVDDVCVIGVRV